MIVVEVENIKTVLKEARDNHLRVFVKDVYIAVPEEKNTYIQGLLEVSTISKTLNEPTLFFYQEEIGSTKKMKTETLEKKCREEIKLLTETLHKEGYDVINGIVRT